jgi:nucleoside phosphorylase
VPAAVDVLVLAAFDPELAPLKTILGERLDARVGEHAIVARTVGVGLAAAAARASMWLSELAPRAVVLAGSCGAYAPSRLVVGDVAVGRRLPLADLAAIDGVAQFPPPMLALALETDAPLSDAIAVGAGEGLRAGACVATTLAITVDDAAASRIAAATSADVEHLEAHGVAAACAAHAIPLAVVLGVANAVGSRGRAEWLANHVRAEEAACARVRAWLERGSPFTV